MKKILFCAFIILIVLYIYFEFSKQQPLSFCFSNTIKCDYNYKYKDTRLEDIIYDIEKNKLITGKHIQNLFVKSSTIYLDLNNLYLNKNSFSYINNLLEILRLYSKEKIVVILSNENNITANNINKWIFKLKEKYDIIISR